MQRIAAVVPLYRRRKAVAHDFGPPHADTEPIESTDQVVTVLAKRHKVDTKNPAAREILAKQVGKYDEAELSKLLLEICLLDSAYQRGGISSHDPLTERPSAIALIPRKSRKLWPKPLPYSRKSTR